MDKKDLEQNILKRWVTLKQEREPFVSQWRAISQCITPASGRWLSGDSEQDNLGRDRWNRIYNNTATRAANICAAGLMSGMTDPSSQWFALTTGDADLDASHQVKIYLDQCQRILEMAFVRTNTYQALHHGWREVSTMGICANVIVEDHRWGFYCNPLVVGEYAIACDYRGQPDTLYRILKMTAGQLVGKFGRNKVPQAVLNFYDKNDRDRKFKVIHAIEPRLERDTTKKDNRNMPWRSIYLLLEAKDATGGILHESGYNEFPCVVGRWGASAADVYSEEAPGMVAIGDVKQLQHQELQVGNATDYMVNPPLILPSAAKNSELDFLPGGRTFVDMAGSQNQVHRAIDASTFQIEGTLMTIEKAQKRINEAFNVDMFLMLSGAAGQMTATEVAERSEEKLMMLGPVLSRLNYEVLKPTIERVYNILQRTNQLPVPPPELQGQTLSIEYTSMLARSQRAIRANSLRNYLTDLRSVAEIKPEVLSKINPFAIADEFADYHSVAPSVVVPTDEAQAAIEQQQQMQQQMAQQQQMAAGADALAKLGRIPAGNETMAGQALEGMAAMEGQMA